MPRLHPAVSQAPSAHVKEGAVSAETRQHPHKCPASHTVVWSGHRNCLSHSNQIHHANKKAGKPCPEQLASWTEQARNEEIQSSQKSDTQQLCQARLRCRFAARGLRAAVAFGSPEKKTPRLPAPCVAAQWPPCLDCWPRTGRAKCLRYVASLQPKAPRRV